MSLSLNPLLTYLNKVNPVFARHETFHPRFGWLKKGFDAALENPKIFLREDAPVILGVGKNMVKSIRYWCHAFKILDNDRPTRFGEQLLEDEGWDCFLEDPASLWLLHWNLLKPTCEAATWYFTFNLFRAVEFADDELFRGLRDYRDANGKTVVDDSLKKDLNCLLKMYVEPRNSNSFVEDSLDCPFTELGLVRTAGDSKRYTFRVGAKSNLPAEILVATCLEYAGRVSPGATTIAVSRLLYDEGSPGMAFKVSESAICDAIEELSGRWQALTLSDSAGLIQFSFQEEPEKLANEILNGYYRVRK
ncbi:DUF4007 family protein [Pannus brasiliensis CCIBt3594]|uniref:DUF4007 family protein n=1 Tax=Pannus brasiliensis CCIBt3594 TaxID=1427578 RepID=A0AAW9QY04_9CHRO